MRIPLRFFCLFLTWSIPLLVSAQDDSSRALVSVSQYTLRVTIDEENHLLQGDARIRLRLLKDSLSTIRFACSSSVAVTAVRDTADKKISFVEELLSSPARREISVPVPDTLRRGDSLIERIIFEESYDTLTTLASFINEREVFLTPGDSIPWWPVLSPSMNSFPNQTAPARFEVTLASSFIPVSNIQADSSNSSTSTSTWFLSYPDPIPLASGLFFCASKNIVKKSLIGNDSVSQCSIYFDPARFSVDLAGAVLAQLREANSYFGSRTGLSELHPNIRLVFIGTDDGEVEWYRAKGILVGRNSPGYASGDTAEVLSSEESPWVHELAHLFSVSTADSSLWLREGWPEFLADKFFLHHAGNDLDAQRAIRSELLSKTLDFYPARPLGHWHASEKNELAILGSKGAYTLLMLEYVIGEDAFAAAAKRLCEVSKLRPVSASTLQKLCEDAYGSPLDWFFLQWMSQPGFPELILATEITQTNRGSYSLKAKISQRGDIFTTPVDLVFSNSLRSVTKRVFVEKQDQEFEFILPFLPTRSELDPNYNLLRWVPRLRLLAHARTSVSFRIFDRNLAGSEREAAIMLQLDPNNITGWNNLALFSLGKSSAIRGDLPKAEEYFRRASALEASAPTQLYSVLSLVRLGNILEMEGKRDEAVELYKLTVTLAERKPALYARALTEAQKYLRQKFASSDEFWYGEY